MHKNINVLIVDDESANRSLLSELLRLNFPHLQLVGTAENILTAKAYFDSHQIDLVLLDIEMPHGNGFELLKQLQDHQFETIFITGFDQYALEAIKVHALDYLLKPIDEEELVVAIHTAIKRIQHSQPNQIHALIQQLQNPESTQSISIHTREKIILIRVNELMYLKADGAITFYYLSDGKRITSTKSIGKNREQLPRAKDAFSHGFYRCHSGYVVNLYYVKEFNKKDQSLILKNGEEIPVSQSKKELLLKLIS